MNTTIGQYKTFDTSFLDEEVRGIAALVEARNTVTMDLIPTGTAGNTSTIKWYDALSNSLQGAVRTGGWNDTDTTGLVIDAQLASIVNKGSILRVGSEVVIVSAVTRTSGSEVISVIARGHGNTTAAAHLADVPIYMVGNANVESTVDGDVILEDNVERKNYFQLVEEPISISRRSKDQSYLDIESKLGEARVKAMSRALRQLNRSILFGMGDAGSASTPATMAGMLDFLQNTSGAITTNVAGAFTEAKLKTTLLSLASAGGNPNVILVSPTDKSVINGFNSAATSTSAGVHTFTGRTDNTAGQIIDFYTGEGVGTIAVVADPQLLSSQGFAFIINTNKCEKIWFEDDYLQFRPEPSNSRSITETLQGSMTFKMKDVNTDHALMYGIA